MRSSVPTLLVGVQRPYAIEIFLRVDGCGRPGTDRYLDGMAVPERAQLLEPLRALELRLGELREPLEKGGRKAVDAKVRERRQLRRGARMGDEAPREVQRAAAVIEHDLHHVRVRRLVFAERASGRRHVAALPNEVRHGGDGSRIDERLVALHVQI